LIDNVAKAIWTAGDIVHRHVLDRRQQPS
jgi:hypothetical protein